MGAAGVQSARAYTVRYKPCWKKAGRFWPPDVDGDCFTLHVCGAHPYHFAHVTITHMTSPMHVLCTCKLQNLHILANITYFSFILWPINGLKFKTNKRLWRVTMVPACMQSLALTGWKVRAVGRLMLVMVDILHFLKILTCEGISRQRLAPRQRTFGRDVMIVTPLFSATSITMGP